MTELAIKPEEIRGAIEQYVEAYRPETTREEVGRVTEVGDGIARRIDTARRGLAPA